MRASTLANACAFAVIIAGANAQDFSYVCLDPADYDGSKEYTYENDDGTTGTSTCDAAIAYNLALKDEDFSQAWSCEGKSSAVTDVVQGITSLGCCGVNGKSACWKDHSHICHDPADYDGSKQWTYEDDDGNVVKDWPKIAKRYTLEGSFLSDFISTFPFESMGSGGWKYTRCMRIVRVKRVLKRYHKLTLESDISFLTLSMVKLVVIIIIALHWAACTFYTMARSVNFAEDTWTGNAAPELGELSLSKAYFACLFWATTAFTTVGYGDMSPVSGSEVVDEELGEVQRSEPEFAFSGFFMTLSLLNMVLSSYFIASITIFMTKGDEETSEYRAEAAFVNESPPVT